ncbi:MULTISPECIES: hypothetical protein [Brenneria]|uniref:Uncharacterized protein n=1 Tax=Brenneria nigrifluens DSM 30175 = ATCC 13028 TaxID=1121120 RepID=A0A2U1US28_9GAMM|nr:MULTISPECIES: hypothetical protein [Brenneria]EHD21066.1 hypothetical protein BrE312_1661 [Brenneria sp. EniD312]PWC24489.1 hypothetical protein DDT54_08830 [Brenneria nigrifluens DSM 30175 = ATCC 13028]QCR04218.1 hypothetical protein EH206_08535 [Brenneria nigrifluens DSM 30175 = ATCC 13028]
MLTILRSAIQRLSRSRDIPPSAAASHARCDECEFCFFNHSATFAVDQINECADGTATQQEKTAQRIAPDG